MNKNYLSIDKDSYKELLKTIKDQSILQAQREYVQNNPQHNQERKSDYQKRTPTEFTLPSIQNSTLNDISKHFQSQRRHKQSQWVDVLEINKSQLKFIQKSFVELEQTKMGMTMREISRTSRVFHGNIRTVTQREPQSLKQLERKLGIVQEQTHQLIKHRNSRNSRSSKIQLPVMPIHTETLQFFEESLNTQAYIKPTRREGAQMQLIRDKLFVFGGMSGGGLSTDVWQYDIKKQEWTSYQSEVDFFRTGHSMVYYRNSLVVFGGSSYYDPKMKLREVYSNIGFFNLSTQQWTFNLESVEPRREHKAIVYGQKYMLVTGGLDSGEALLNDSIVYNLETKKWVWAKIYLDEGVAQHAMCLAQDTPYLFGGRTKSLGSFPLMKLTFIGQQPKRWEKMVYTGIAPNGRYNHTMECVGDNLVIIGGRSDQLPEYESDLHVFNLISNSWSLIKKEGLSTKRWSHSSCQQNGQILCFGGIGEDSYLPPLLYAIETDPIRIRGRLAVMKKSQKIEKVEKPPKLPLKKEKTQLKLIEEIKEENKRPCRLERYQNTRKRYEKINTFIALPQLKQPKFRYDILMHFVKQVLIKIKYL